MIPYFLIVGLSLMLVPALRADDPEPLAEPLKVFQPLVGKTFEGNLLNAPADNPMRDVSRWERALNGQAIRILHSINDGVYGGETILMWDPERKKIAFWSFTTDGFHTEGIMDVEGNRWSSVEEVTGNADGITEVKSTSEWSDGKLTLRSEYKKNGE